MCAIYTSHEDSELIRKAIRAYSGDTCLEIGFGYGSNLLELQNQFGTTAGTEINLTKGFKLLRQNKIDLLLADGASCFKNESFDLIVINPPYLPSEQIEDISIDGGRGGFEVARKFLLEASRALRSRGKILILLSSETSSSDFTQFCRQERLSVKQIISTSLFFETLTVYELQKRT